MGGQEWQKAYRLKGLSYSSVKLLAKLLTFIGVGKSACVIINFVFLSFFISHNSITKKCAWMFYAPKHFNYWRCAFSHLEKHMLQCASYSLSCISWSPISTQFCTIVVTCSYSLPMIRKLTWMLPFSQATSVHTLNDTQVKLNFWTAENGNSFRKQASGPHLSTHPVFCIWFVGLRMKISNKKRGLGMVSIDLDFYTHDYVHFYYLQVR